MNRIFAGLVRTGLQVGAVTALAMVSSSFAHAVPTRQEVYRSDRLKTVIFKDGNDPSVFWYLPPIKLYENDGKVVYYKRVRDGQVQYFFYVQPYMNDELIGLLAGEVPGLQNVTQLKPVQARQFGIQVKQFNVNAMGDRITDFHYLNQPHLIKTSLAQADAEEFEFFLNNKPGIQAHVLFDYETERMDKYLNIELSYKEVYNALNIGATGKYQFARAEIATAVANYVGNKYFTVKSKGDIAIPEIVNKVIEECFTPMEREKKEKKKNYRDWDDWLVADVTRAVAAEAWDRNAERLESLVSGWDLGENRGGSGGDKPWDDEPRPRGPSGASGGTAGAELMFTFKRELANSEKVFFYKQEHFVESGEIAAIPVYLSLLPAEAKARVQVVPLARREFVVESTHEEKKPLRTGLTVGLDEQYDINAVFAYQARSAYASQLKYYRWDSAWPNADEELYYRVGTGPWNKVNRYSKIKIEGIYRGELQFYLDRKKLWEKIPKEFKETKMLGMVPAIFTFANTFPQFNVVITGRKVRVSP